MYNFYHNDLFPANFDKSDWRYSRSYKRSLDLLKGSIDEQFQAVEQLRKSNIRNHVDEVREALRTACNDWVKAFLIEALIEQSVSEEFVMEREGLEYRFVPCALTLPGQSDGVNQAVSHLREWFENEDPSFLTFCVPISVLTYWFSRE